MNELSVRTAFCRELQRSTTDNVLIFHKGRDFREKFFKSSSDPWRPGIILTHPDHN
jgi:hypothetical protein